MNSSDYLIFLTTTNKMKQINKNEEEKIVREQYLGYVWSQKI